MKIYAGKTNQVATSIHLKPIIRLLLPAILSLGVVACGVSDGDPEPTNSTSANAARTTPLSTTDTDCPNGGILVETGIHENGNGLLESAEVDTAEKVCHGVNGSNGTNAIDGTNGVDGAGGTNGLNSLTHQIVELAGINCVSGGFRLDAGADLNGSNVLDAFEIESSEFICNGESGSGIVADSLGIVSAISISNTEILVQFSEPMQGDAENPTHYSITTEQNSTRLPVWDAIFANADNSSVKISTFSQSSVGYQLKVANLRDLDGNPIAEPTLDPDVLVDHSSTTFAGTDPNVLTVADSDGDSLTDHTELVGWDVTIVYGNGTTESWHVSSDPGDPNQSVDAPINVALRDTDGDGVTDNEEKHGGLEPRNPDTDGDTLTDDQEWNRIFSDGTLQDSDGDGVQDGFEYYTFRTSPILVDTDGDQIDDLEEVTSGNRNPLIADLPQVRFTVRSPNLQLNTQFSFTDGQGSTQTVSQTNEAQSKQQSNVSSTQKTIESSKSLTAEVSFTPKALTGGIQGLSVKKKQM